MNLALATHALSPTHRGLSRTDAGVHARSFRLVAPLLRIQAECTSRFDLGWDAGYPTCARGAWA